LLLLSKSPKTAKQQVPPPKSNFSFVCLSPAKSILNLYLSFWRKMRDFILNFSPVSLISLSFTSVSSISALP